MSSEQQSEIFLTLKDLADDQLLEMKTRILETLNKVRNEGDAAVADLSDQLSVLAEASREQKTLCTLNSRDFETRQGRQIDIPDTSIERLNGSSTTIMGRSISMLVSKSGCSPGMTFTGYRGSPEQGSRFL